MIAHFTEDNALSLPAVFDVLADEVRFRLLIRLHAGGPADRHDMEELATAVGPGGGDPDLVAARLHHVHLPKLSASGVVDWQRDGGWVRRGPAFSAVDRVLDSIVGYDGRPTVAGSDPDG